MLYFIVIKLNFLKDFTKFLFEFVVFIHFIYEFDLKSLGFFIMEINRVKFYYWVFIFKDFTFNGSITYIFNNYVIN